MNLSILENRLLHEIPEEYHEDIQREIAKFETEISRMSPEEDKVGQASLSRSEIDRLNTTNQEPGGEGLTTIQWQVVKGHAIENDVSDWTSKVDGTLSKSENVALMQNDNKKTNRNTHRKWK